MIVIARTDPHAIHQDAFEAHPEWVACDADGKPEKHWATPDLWVTCAIGPYNFELMTEVHQRDHHAISRRRHLQQPLVGARHLLLRTLPAELQEATGYDLPTHEGHRCDPAFRAYTEWHQDKPV